MKIVVWFSCGAASAVAAQQTLLRYPDANVRIVNNPVAEEDEDNRRFLADVERWLGVEVERATNSKWPDASAAVVWEARKYMAGIKGAICTLALKKEARYQWEKTNRADFHVLGFTADEEARHKRFVLTERSNVLPVLIDAGITKERCKQIILEAGIRLPRVYDMGFKNANCIGCVKATSPKYWALVREQFPAVFEERKEQSERLGVRLVRVKGKRSFLSELPATVDGTMPDAPDCGIFCEEKPMQVAEKLPAIGSVWQRRGRLRRVIAADAFRKRRPRDLLPPEDTQAVHVFYSDGSARNKRCGWPTWRKWARHALPVSDDSGTFALEMQS